MGQIAEGTVDQTGDELAASDEEGVDGDELSSLMGGGHFSYVDRDCHGGDAWGGDQQKEATLKLPAVLEEQVGRLCPQEKPDPRSVLEEPDKAELNSPIPRPTVTRPPRSTSLLGAKPRMTPPMLKMKLAIRMQIRRPSQPFRKPPPRDESAAAPTVLDTSSSCQRLFKFNSFFRGSMAPDTTPVS